jgi:hypothetical protein
MRKFVNVEDMIEKRLFTTLMTEGQGWDSFKNFAGDHREGWVQGVSRSRDSEIDAESNFEAMLENLGGEKEGIVEVVRFGHWAVGWVEHIHVSTKAPPETLMKMMEMMNALIDYPLLDEDDYYERQREQYEDYAEGAKKELAEALVKHLGFPEEWAEDKEVLAVAYQMNLVDQEYNGGDSCIDLYPFREPEPRDWEDVVRALEEMSGYMEHNKFFQILASAFNLEDE